MTGITGEVRTLLDEAWELILSTPAACGHDVPWEELPGYWRQKAEKWRARCAELARAGSGGQVEAGPEPELPEGEFGRIEMPGYRQHTGWVTDGTRFGHPVAVVRDWDGHRRRRGGDRAWLPVRAPADAIEAARAAGSHHRRRPGPR
jgi:hypothetical protein